MEHEEAAREAAAGSADQSELRRLRSEVDDLRARLGGRRSIRLLAVRRFTAALLAVLVALCAVTSVVGVWGARTPLNTSRWVATVGPLPENPAVNAAVSTYLTDQVLDRVDVERRIVDALPERAAFLAAPVTGSVHDYLRKSVSELLATDRFQALWRAANRSAHATILAVLERKKENVQVQGDTVALNLLPMVNNLLTAVEDRMPRLFARTSDLPTLSSGEIPPGLHDRIEKALGVSLPEDFAQVRLYNRDELGQLQQAVLLFRRAVVALLLGTVLLSALALWISPVRRRSVLQFGLCLVLCVVALEGVLRAVRNQILAQVPQGVYRNGVRAALRQVFTTLRERGDELLWFGVAVALMAYLIGPGRLPVALRHHAVDGARASGRLAARAGQRLTEHPGARSWIRRHADVLRVAGAVVAAFCALLPSSWAGLLVVALLLAAYQVAVTLVARAGASPPAGEARAEGTEQTGAAR